MLHSSFFFSFFYFFKYFLLVTFEDRPKVFFYYSNHHLFVYFYISPQVTYDVTISNNSLLEIHSHEERLNIVNILWKKTNDFLILIENGSLEGYVTLMEARNMILAKGDSDSELREEWKDGHVGHVFAPVGITPPVTQYHTNPESVWIVECDCRMVQ